MAKPLICNTCKKPFKWPDPYVKGVKLDPKTGKPHVCDLREYDNTPGPRFPPLEEDDQEDQVFLKSGPLKDPIPTVREKVTDLGKQVFESGIDTLKHDFSFRALEVTLGRTRKVSNNTLAGLPQFETIEFSIYQKFQVDYTTDIPRLIKETWAKMALQIEREIDAEGERLNP